MVISRDKSVEVETQCLTLYIIDGKEDWETREPGITYWEFLWTCVHVHFTARLNGVSMISSVWVLKICFLEWMKYGEGLYYTYWEEQLELSSDPCQPLSLFSRNLSKAWYVMPVFKLFEILFQNGLLYVLMLVSLKLIFKILYLYYIYVILSHVSLSFYEYIP